MDKTLRTHLETITTLPQTVIDEVCQMYKTEADTLLGTLSGVKNVEVRGIIESAMRSYHKAFEWNNKTFVQVAGIISGPIDTTTTANDDSYTQAA